MSSCLKYKHKPYGWSIKNNVTTALLQRFRHVKHCRLHVDAGFYLLSFAIRHVLMETTGSSGCLPFGRQTYDKFLWVPPNWSEYVYRPYGLYTGVGTA